MNGHNIREYLVWNINGERTFLGFVIQCCIKRLQELQAADVGPLCLQQLVGDVVQLLLVGLLNFSRVSWRGNGAITVFILLVI